MKSSKSSAKKYLLVIFLIIAIFGVTAKLYVYFSKIPLLKSLKEVVAVKGNFSNLDSCIFKLYNAENSCTLYIVSGNHKYYQQFTDEINEVVFTIDSIEIQNQKESPLSSESFNSLIAQKKIRTSQFIQLKNLADSLINFTVNLDKEVDKLKTINTVFTTKKFKKFVKIDTIKPKIAEEPQNKRFSRFFTTIKDKGERGTDSSKSTLIKTTITADTTLENVAFNKLQLNEINKLYIKLHSTNNKLEAKEIHLLNINHKLILSVVDALKIYKLNENNYHIEIQKIINLSTYDALNNLDNFSLILGLFFLALLIFTFYTIYSLYRNEKIIIEQSNKASLYALSKSRFLANMSHEIRTPLNSIVGFSEQLGQVNLEPQQKEQVSAIRNSSLMLLDVVNDILDFSKYETGKVTLESIPFSPFLAISDVFDSMKVQANKKKIGFINDIEIDKDVFILGDPLRLKQIVMNLLNNAIKFTDEGSVTIKGNLISAGPKNILLRVSIVDTGVGINEIDQRIIFDEFAQVYYSSTKEKQQGTGLGLAICKKIIEFQGGEIIVSSEENKGSLFSFELPYEVTAKVLQEDPKVLIIAEIELLKGKRVLLADDNMLNILLASTILKKYNINFDAAYNGKEALGLFLENDYDIVLTDIQMPEMGGIELAKNIRSSVNTKKSRVPILGITANVIQEDRTKYLESGLNDLVLKPFFEKELLEKILKFLK